jgi:hypothetical protein
LNVTPGRLPRARRLVGANTMAPSRARSVWEETATPLDYK